MNKKYLIVLTCLLAAGLLVSIFFIDKHSKNVKVNINKNEVMRIHVSYSMPLFDKFEVTDSKEIITIVDYLNSLTKKNTKKNPGDYFGGGYGIKLYLKGGKERTLFFTGYRFLSETNRFTYEIPYREAAKFDTIVADMLKGSLSKKGCISISGTVEEVESEQSGANIKCSLKAEGNTKYNIFLRNTKIMDGTGSGNLMVYKGDKIKVFYLKDQQTDKDRIQPTMVFIESTSR